MEKGLSKNEERDDHVQNSSGVGVIIYGLGVEIIKRKVMMEE